MGGAPPQPPPRFSPDGLWWWDGKEWKPAVSPDRRWRWNGQAWIPNQAAGMSAGSAAGLTVGIVVAGLGVIVFVSFVTIIVLLTMGHQITNVFSNVTAALGS